MVAEDRITASNAAEAAARVTALLQDAGLPLSGRVGGLRLSVRPWEAAFDREVKQARVRALPAQRYAQGSRLLERVWAVLRGFEHERVRLAVMPEYDYRKVPVRGESYSHPMRYLRALVVTIRDADDDDLALERLAARTEGYGYRV